MNRLYFGDNLAWLRNRDEFNQCPNVAVVEMMEAFHAFLKNSPMMAYLAMMAPRLVELHRVLKETGSLYLHCDDVASHYLKLLLDGVFGPRQFRSEIVWKRTSAHGNARRTFGVITDCIFNFSKGEEPTFNREFTPYDPEYLAPSIGTLTLVADATVWGI
jgi:site-specific DNA-methyltransferase (adenine-specific)